MSERPWFYVEARTNKNKYRRHALDGDLLLVEEQHDVRIVVEVDGSETLPTATLDARSLPWDAKQGAFVLEGSWVNHWVGTVELLISHGTRTRALQLEVAPHRKKATPDAWLRMLRQIDAWMPGITLGADPGRHGQIGTDGVSAPLLAEALTPLLPLFAQALREIVNQPRTGEHEHWQDTKLRASRQDRDSTRWLSRRPHATAWIRADEPSGPEPRIPARRGIQHLDHPANRYVAGTVDSVIEELTRVRERLGELATHYAKKRTLNDTGDWCQARAERLAEHLAELERIWHGSSLRRLTPTQSPGTALAVIIDHPSYARIHQLGRLLLSPRFRLPKDDTPTPEYTGAAPIRASFDLYELWTFLFVQRSLAARLSASAWTWQDSNLSALLDATETGEGARFVAHGPKDTMVEILFNESFTTCPHGELRDAATPPLSTPARCFSLSQPRRPDLLVRWHRPGQEGRWVCLDAKYYEPGNLKKAMQTLHTYRDALWMDGFGGRCRAGLLLAPAASPTTSWTAPAYRDRFDIGVWECPPGRDPDLALADWLLARLRR